MFTFASPHVELHVLGAIALQDFIEGEDFGHSITNKLVVTDSFMDGGSVEVLANCWCLPIDFDPDIWVAIVAIKEISGLSQTS